ncbi:hypothetical protein REPUB_Repub13aG0261400 [Reevesia pubescens]
MPDRHQHLYVMKKVARQFHLGSSLSQDVQYRYGGFQRPVLLQRRFASSSCNVALQYPMTSACQANYDLSLVGLSSSPICVQAPQ